MSHEDALDLFDQAFERDVRDVRETGAYMDPRVPANDEHRVLDRRALPTEFKYGQDQVRGVSKFDEV